MEQQQANQQKKRAVMIDVTGQIVRTWQDEGEKSRIRRQYEAAREYREGHVPRVRVHA